ncbi:MAG: Aminomethyltransferase, mitochondrial, partial [Cyphobasidiales sp. Tagirdzhanova-0007]
MSRLGQAALVRAASPSARSVPIPHFAMRAAKQTMPPILGSSSRAARPFKTKSHMPVSSFKARSYATEGSAPPAVSSSSKAAITTPNTPLLRTPLYDLHIEYGAKMVPFAGFEMPLTYRWGGQLNEHHQVRKKAGLFDVSHMVQSVVSGPGATRFLSHLLPSSLSALQAKDTDTKRFDPRTAEGPFLSSLTLLLNKEGGIIDDLMLTRQGKE